MGTHWNHLLTSRCFGLLQVRTEARAKYSDENNNRQEGEAGPNSQDDMEGTAVSSWEPQKRYGGGAQGIMWVVRA